MIVELSGGPYCGEILLNVPEEAGNQIKLPIMRKIGARDLTSDGEIPVFNNVKMAVYRLLRAVPLTTEERNAATRMIADLALEEEKNIYFYDGTVS